MLRGLRAILDADSALTLRAGVNRGPPSPATSARAPPRLRRDGRHRQPRRAPGRTRRAGRDPRHRRGARALAHAVRDHAQPFLVKGKERAITAYSVGSATGVAEEEAAKQLPIVGREQAVELRRRRRGAHAPGPDRRAVGEPGIGKSRLVEELKTMAVGFTQLVTRCDQYASLRCRFPFRAAAAARRDHRGRERRGGRRTSEAVGRGRDARVRALAPACWRSRSTPRSRRRRRARRSRPPSAASVSSRRSSSSCSGAGDADADRRRGRALDGRRLAGSSSIS